MKWIINTINAICSEHLHRFFFSHTTCTRSTYMYMILFYTEENHQVPHKVARMNHVSRSSHEVIGKDRYRAPVG